MIPRKITDSKCSQNFNLQDCSVLFLLVGGLPWATCAALRAASQPAPLGPYLPVALYIDFLRACPLNAHNAHIILLKKHELGLITL